MTTSRPPRLEVQLVSLAEEHYESVACAHLAAMKEDNMHIRAFPLDRRPSHKERIKHNITLRRKPVPADVHQVVAILPGSSPSRAIGYAKWLAPVDRTTTLGYPTEEEKLAKAQEVMSEYERAFETNHVDVDFFGAFIGQNIAGRREIFEGKEHWYLVLLVVDPEFQGMGVGSALINYGLSKADAAGLPCFLESSNRGRPVYEAKGFEVVRWSEVEDENEEGGKLRWPHLVRKARRVEADA